MILYRIRQWFSKFKRNIFDQGVTVSEYDESFPNEYAMHIKQKMGRIYTTFDFEAVIYHKTNLKSFALVYYKVKNVKSLDSRAPNMRYKLLTKVISSKRIPDDVQKFIKENQQDPACEVSFTTGPHNFKI
jgi:hypothetical protein